MTSVLDNLSSCVFSGVGDDHLLGGDAGDGGDQVVAVDDADDVLLQVGEGLARLDALPATTNPPALLTRSKACPSCQPAYDPLIMLDPRPRRPPAKPVPPTWESELNPLIISPNTGMK